MRRFWEEFNRYVRPALFLSILTSVLLFNLYVMLAEAHIREEAQRAMQTPLLAQSQGARPPYEWLTNDLDRRLTNIEDQKLDRRVGIIESSLVDMKDVLADLKRWNQGIAVTVIGHMLITGFGLGKKGTK